MSKITNELYQCICDKGQIKLIKREYETVRSNKIKVSVVGLSPCPVCGSKVDSDGDDHSKFK
jgi:hypothetical protein